MEIETKGLGPLACKTCKSDKIIAITDTNEIIYPFCLDCLWERNKPQEMIDFGIEFRRKLRNKGIGSLYTLIPKDSLESVLKYGILSRQRANETPSYTSQGLDFIYDSDSIQHFDTHSNIPVSLNRYVRTHLNSDNIFIRNLLETYEDQFILIEIDLGVLDQVGTLFTTRSLSHPNVNIFLDMNSLHSSQINWIVIQDITPVLDLWEDEKKIIDLEYQSAAEILIYSHIPNIYLSKILVDSKSEQKIFKNMLELIDHSSDVRVEIKK